MNAEPCELSHRLLTAPTSHSCGHCEWLTLPRTQIWTRLCQAAIVADVALAEARDTTRIKPECDSL